MTWKLVLLSIVVLIAVVILVEARMTRGKYRPLASRFARERKGPMLGMEATDEASVAGVLHRNSGLARKTGVNGKSHTWIAAGAVTPAPFPEDETYAARFSGTHDERK
jgi:hypothetical protein